MAERYDIAIIGAGPSGIMAAVAAGRLGKKVILIEKNDAIGRKILATGNGRCNLTNNNISLSHYHGEDVKFAEYALSYFDENNTISFFESLGVLVKEEDRGRIFPRNDQARTVVDALSSELVKIGITVKTATTVKQIENKTTWEIQTENKERIEAKKLILTTGGKAAHQFGSSGDGLFWAKNLGHTIIPIHAALVPIETTESSINEIMGIKIKAKVDLISKDKIVDSKSGDIIFTHFGVSGPAAMGIARTASHLLEKSEAPYLSFDFIPDIEKESLDDILKRQLSLDGKKSIKSILGGIIPKNLGSYILASIRIKDDTKAAELSKADRDKIINSIKNFKLEIKRVRPLKEAQVTAGGVSTKEISKSLESLITKNLYFAGEIIDIDGDSGGFNLQWAWSSGKLAGDAAAMENLND